MKKIYFAGSIRGGRDYAAMYRALIESMNTFAEVLTEHISDRNLSVSGEAELSDAQIYTRDMDWLRSCDGVVAEVSAPSLGVGYEIGCAEMAGIPVLCLYHQRSEVSLSAMLSGNAALTVYRYEKVEDALETVRNFVSRR